MDNPAIQLFGEILFDHFPDGRSVLGGAPFNVAWHLHAFGEAPVMHSRVGRDAPGELVLAAMNDWGMDRSGLQLDAALPTGRVDVTLVDGEPQYEIVHPAAWDAIEAAEPRPGWLYHGSLALRDERSRAALEALAGPAMIFLDVNLRDPWWDKSMVHNAMHRASWVKLNEAELRCLASGKGDLPGLADRVFQAFALDGLIVTRGAAGALVMGQRERVDAGPEAAVSVVDTVGAGDAFSSVILLGLRRGWPLTVSVERALAFAAAICGVRGATVARRSFYTAFLERWQADGTH